MEAKQALEELDQEWLFFLFIFTYTLAIQRKMRVERGRCMIESYEPILKRAPSWLYGRETSMN